MTERPPQRRVANRRERADATPILVWNGLVTRMRRKGAERPKSAQAGEIEGGDPGMRREGGEGVPAHGVDGAGRSAALLLWLGQVDLGVLVGGSPVDSAGP